MQPHLLFVSTSNLATNPRLVKEIELALAKGYRVTALVCSFHNWSYELNETVKLNLEGKIHLIEAVADRSSFITWVASTLLQKFQQLKKKLGFSGAAVLSDVLIKRSILLRWELKKLKKEYQLVIAHNPGAFEPTASFAKKYGIPLGIDVEDYHPGETTNPKQIQLIRLLLQQVLPKAVYISVAAPLILDAIQQDCGQQLHNTFTVLNYFNKEEFAEPEATTDKPLQCVWFSQNISFNRGLENLLPIFKDKEIVAQLHLFGNLDSFFGKQWIQDADKVILHPPLPQQELHNQLKNFDVGLAIEPGKDLNNQLAVSNKLLSYYQAGLYILATNTPAQQQFMQTHPAHGTCISMQELQNKLKQLILQKEMLRADACKRYKGASRNHAAAELQQLVSNWQNFAFKSC